MAAIKDQDLLALAGSTLRSTRHAGVSYGMEKVLGSGAHGVAFLANRVCGVCSAPVVLKLLHPRAIRELGARAGAAVEKEVVTLERLSTQFPPTPHVVRLLDTGTFRPDHGTLDLPWLALEYVNGGSDGATLGARVENERRRTGSAFDCRRAHLALASMIAGLETIHALGVVHRDVAPGNVLTTGSGDEELFKIADFGLARVHDAATFGKVLLGTPGYCAPEQSFPDKSGVGPYTDVFGLACCVYFALTGERYFDATSIAETLLASHHSERRSIRDSPSLCSPLRQDAVASREIDRALARATHVDPRHRTQSATELGAALLPVLAARRESVTFSKGPPRSARDAALLPSGARLRFTVRRTPDTDTHIRSVAWDLDGHFMATTTTGLAYWDGWQLRPVRVDAFEHARVVHRAGLRRWLLGGANGTLMRFDGRRMASLASDPAYELVSVTGDSTILAVARRRDGEHELWTWTGDEPETKYPLPGFAAASGCVPLPDERWLIGGGDANGGGRLAVFERRRALVTMLPALEHPVLAVAAREGVVLCTGAGGRVTRLVDGVSQPDHLPHTSSVTAAAIDADGRAWVGVPGALWSGRERWRSTGRTYPSQRRSRAFMPRGTS
jgi:serine/threonine protein kinase